MAYGTFEIGQAIRGARARICAAAAALAAASTFAGAQQALATMDDITCYKPNEWCESDPAGWADGQAYEIGRSVCRLKIYAASAGVPEQLHGVCTGWLVDVAGRDDLVITSLHCVELGVPMFGPNVAPPPRSSGGSCMPGKCEPPPNPAPGMGPPWFVTRVVCEFTLEYAPDCDCENGAGGAPCDPLNSCDTPEAAEATCTDPLVWESTTWADGGDGCDWVLLKVSPNAGGVLPGAIYPELSLGMHHVPEDLLMPQHPEGRCKEIAEGVAKGVYDACDFAHDVEAQHGSSGSPLVYLNNGFPEVMGVLHGVIVAGNPPAGIVIGDGVAVDAARVSASLPVAIALVDAPPAVDCIPGGGGGNLPAQGTGGGGTWPGTLPGSALVAAHNVTVPAGSTEIVAIKLRGLAHSWIGDLHFVLEEPLGTKHNLLCRPGGGNATSYGLSCDANGDYVIYGGAYTGNLAYACNGASFDDGSYEQHFGAWPSGSAGVANTALADIPVSDGAWKLRVYDWASGDTGTLASWELCFDLADGAQALACQLQPTASQGCMSTAAASGSASATSASPFVVTFAGLNGQVNGVVFYGITGAASATWTAQSLMCVKAPTQRLNGVPGAFGSTGGMVGACNGAYSFDMNAVMQAPGSLGTPMSPGQAVIVQGWQRDPASSKTTNLTQALSFTVGP